MKYLARTAFNAMSLAGLTPHGDRVLCEEVEIEKVAHVAGGFKLFMPETHDEEIENNWKLVQIVAVGSGHRLETDVTVPMPFKPGECWFIERLTGRPISLHGTTYRIVNQTDILFPAPPEISAAVASEPTKARDPVAV